MRHSLTYLAALLLAIQIVRVARFSWVDMRAGALGAVFAVAIAAGVFVAAYWTRQSASRGDAEDKRSQAARQWATGTLVLFVVVDGGLNFADVYSASWPATLPLQIAAGVYALFPTLASAALAALQGKVDRLPHVSKPSAIAGAWAAMWRRISKRLDTETTQAPAQPASNNGYHEAAVCGRCGLEWGSYDTRTEHGKRQRASAIASHSRYDCPAKIKKEMAR
jgi:hypothetical protein